VQEHANQQRVREGMRDSLLWGSWIQESVTYQMIIEEGVERGEVLGRRQTRLELGTDTLGPPSRSAIAAIEALTNPDDLRRAGRTMLTAASWDDLLGAM
jgi:predicted transposase YdaD